MNPKQEKRISKALALALRHRPELFDLDLDQQGWCRVAQLLANFQKKNIEIDRLVLERIVKHNDKQRFALTDDGRKIRANQGHSIEVDLAYQPARPPELLYHGTAKKYWPSIHQSGLQKQSRQHVHLSKDVATAKKVGQRHGQPVVLTVFARQMEQDGFVFYCSANGVWLTEEVPTVYLRQGV